MATKPVKVKSRKTRQNKRSTRGKPSQKTLDGQETISFKALTLKLELIEARLQRVEAAAGVDAPEYFWNAYRQAQRKRPGKKPAYREPALLARRDAVVTYLEMNWPEIRLAIQTAQSPEDLKQAFKKAQRPAAALVEPEFVRQPLEFLNECFAFVRSERYSNNPRRLADAMAGLPKLRWKRSLDICSASKCTLLIEPRAIRDWLRRKYPQRLRELLRVSDKAEIVSILQRSRTKDPQYRALLENPIALLETLKAGQPGVWA
jgi:hypothetical protein